MQLYVVQHPSALHNSPNSPSPPSLPQTFPQRHHTHLVAPEHQQGDVVQFHVVQQGVEGGGAHGGGQQVEHHL